MIVLALRHVVASGQSGRSVVCEKCRLSFDYLMSRSAALDTVPLPPLVRMAERICRQRVARRLARDVDPHPCPGCGWVQADMVPALRGRFAWGLRVLGILLVAAGLALAALVAAAGAWLHFQADRPDFDWVGAAAACVGVAALGALVMLARAGLARLRYRAQGHQGEPSPAPGIRCRCGYDLRATPDRCPECGTPCLAA